MDLFLPRYDIIIAPSRESFRASEHGLKALVQYLTMSQHCVPFAETIDEDTGEVRIRTRADEYGHQVLREGSAPPGGPPFHELTIWQGPARSLPFGQERQAAFLIEVFGSLYPNVLSSFLERLHSILYLRPVAFSQPHDEDAFEALQAVATGTEQLPTRRAAASTEELDLDL